MYFLACGMILSGHHARIMRSFLRFYDFSKHTAHGHDNKKTKLKLKVKHNSKHDGQIVLGPIYPDSTRTNLSYVANGLATFYPPDFVC